MYSLTRDRPRHRVTLKFSGQMTQDPRAFSAELTAAALSVQSDAGSWDMLVDFTDTPVMPRDRAENTERLYQWCASNGVRKIAFVVHSTIQKMQLKRVTKADKSVACFDDLMSARRWLMEDCPSM